MRDLKHLYQSTILDHNKNPRHFGALADPTHTAHGHNPLCGDDYTVSLEVSDNRIQNIGIEGNGCAISKAAASMMAQTVIGKAIDDVVSMSTAFVSLVTGAGEPGPAIGSLAVFAGVRQFPIRVKCATLPWRALEAAIQTDISSVITTE